MIGTSALSAAFAFAQIPNPVVPPAELEPARIEVTVQTTGEHFSAANDSFLHQVLLFGSRDLGTFASLHLGPGGSAWYPFPRGAAEDLWIEVVAMEGSRWRNTGALSLAAVEKSERGTLWVQENERASLAWIVGESGLEHLIPNPSLCSETLLAAHSGLRSFAYEAPTHVPLPLPTPDEKEGPPPVLDKKPLPPF